MRPHRLVVLNAWSPDGGTDVRGKLRVVGSYLEEVEHECIKWGLRHQRYVVAAWPYLYIIPTYTQHYSILYTMLHWHPMSTDAATDSRRPSDPAHFSVSLAQ